MERDQSVFNQRAYWAGAVGIVALAFWIVGVGVGARAWILTDGSRGLVAHVESFGRDATVWFITASVLTMTTVLMAVGIAVVRHLVGVGKPASKVTVPKKESLKPEKPLEPIAETQP